MNRAKFNFIIDLVSFINLLGIILTGFILKYILPPGSGGLGQISHGGKGGEHIKQLFSMNRHEFGDIHFFMSIAFICLMLIHIIMHWEWIKNYFKKIFRV